MTAPWRLPALLATLILLISCTAQDPPERDAGLSARPTANTGSPTTPLSPPARAETITVDWSSKGLRWPTQWQLGYGRSDQELGIKWYPDQDPIVPSAVAALPGGSFAVVDPQHLRVVEVSSTGDIGRTIASVPQVASDIAWDRHNDRLVVIADESHGKLIELPADGPASTVDLGRAVSRLVPTDQGVYEGAPGNVSALLPSPLTAQPAAGSGRLNFADGTTLTFSSNRAGSRWDIERGGRWSLDLGFAGENGPRKPVLSLTMDMLIVGDTLVMAPLVGTFAQADVSRQLLLVRVDLRTGTLLDAQHLRQCGLAMEENVVSRITASNDGTIYQFCVGEHGVQLRRSPQRD